MRVRAHAFEVGGCRERRGPTRRKSKPEETLVLPASQTSLPPLDTRHEQTSAQWFWSAKERTRSPLPDPPHAGRHDEWLLDEALTETFPCSDSIAVSLERPTHPIGASPPGRVRKDGVSGRISDCNVGHGSSPEALETAIECDHCHTWIPATVALNFEGADYIYHFCGPRCLDAWCEAPNAHAK